MHQTPFTKAFKETIAERIYREGLALGEAGRKIFGVYCAFTPKEIIAAAGGIPVALCAGTDQSIPAAETQLPRNLCPLVKSTFGHALQGSCQYMEETAFIFADMTCDGKKKMFEFLGRIKPLHLLALPQDNQRAASRRMWLEELYLLKKIVEEQAGHTVADDALLEQIRLYNDLRRAVEEVYDLNRGTVPLLTGREVAAITEEGAGFECHLAQRAANMRRYAAQARERSDDRDFLDSMRRKPRILLTGCPTTNIKILDILENAGAVVVAMENCGGLKTTGLVQENGDPMQALADRYLSTPCPCMAPNTARLDLISRLAEAFHVQGVVELTWDACHTYNVEAGLVREHVTESLDLPYLQVRTDYTENDRSQIQIRVDAFLEMI